jgi:hypothetical protein
MGDFGPAGSEIVDFSAMDTWTAWYGELSLSITSSAKGLQNIPVLVTMV